VPEPKPQQFNDLSTTIGEGKVPPAAKELKEALHGGIKLKEEPAVNSIISIKGNGKPKPLDPTLPPFVPLSVGNGPSTTAGTSTGTTPVYSKLAENGNSSGASNHSTSTSFSNCSQLNPESKEFIPRGNATDSALYGNGNASIAYGAADDELEQGWNEVGSILRGFERAAPISSEDVSGNAVLEAGAEILLKVCAYPGSFQEIGVKFQEVLNSNKPSKDTITNLAEMFIYWVSGDNCRLPFASISRFIVWSFCKNLSSQNKCFP